MVNQIETFAVSAIYICPDAGQPMIKTESATAKREQGLLGDRYADKKGFWQNISRPANIVRDVSIINAKDIAHSGFTECETRRNIVVNGQMRLTGLIGKRFYIGDVLFYGSEECTPCRRPSDLSGKPGFASAFKDKGGLRAQVLNDGTIKVGDQFRAVEV